MRGLLTILGCCCFMVMSANRTITVAEYVETYQDLAVAEMLRSGIPASIKLAQGILESQHGNSLLSRKSNNHFGIKCKKEWQGNTYYHKDDDRNKEGHLINSCFRAYDSPIESYVDHTEFLVNRERYNFVFGYDKTDYKGWARGLKKAGYATAPKYAESIIGIIERNNLSRFDLRSFSNFVVNYQPIFDKLYPPVPEPVEPTEPVVTEPVVVVTTPPSEPTEPITEPTAPIIPTEEEKVEEEEIALFPIKRTNQIFKINGLPVIQLDDKLTIEDIAEENGLSKKKIFKYNDFTEYLEPIPNQYIFLKKKKSRSLALDYHVVKKGQTMYVIAQLYGIRLKTLMKRNRMKKNEEPTEGDRIKLN